MCDVEKSTADQHAHVEGQHVNQALEGIQQELQDYLTSKEGLNMDSFLYYLYGLVLRQQNMQQKAMGMLTTAIEKYPLNWSAWQELSLCIPSMDVVRINSVHTLTRPFLIGSHLR